MIKRSAKVVKLRVIECGSLARIDANRVLSRAKNKLSETVVLGYDHDGNIYAASSRGPGDTLWLMEQAKKWLLDGCPSPDGHQ